MTQAAEEGTTLFQLAGIGVVETDMTTGRFLRVNQAFCEIVGYSETELHTMTNTDLTHPEDWERDGEKFAAMKRGDLKEDKAITRVLHKDGHEVWLELTITLLGEGDTTRNLTLVTDVTQRELSEKALREIEARYNLIFDATEIASWDWNIEADRVAWNDQHYYLLGLEPQVVTPTAELFLRYVHPDDTARIRQALERALVEGTYQEEFRVVRSNTTEVHWMSGYGRVVKRKGGHAIRTVGILRDITGSKRAKTSLAFLAEISQDLAGLTNIDETMDALGAKIAGHLSLSACAFVELQDSAQIGIINYGWHRADMPSLLGTYRMKEFMTEEVIQSCRAGEAVVIRDVFADPMVDGEQYAALNIGSFVSIPLVRSGEWRFLLVVYRSEPYDWREDEVNLLREFTTRIWTRLERARVEEALAESEARNRLLIDQAEDYAIVSLDLSGKITDWNLGATAIFGWEKAEAVGQSVALLFTPEARAEHVPEYEIKQATETSYANNQRWMLRKDGSQFWANGAMRSLQGDDSRLRGLFKIMRDETARKTAQEALQELNKTLEQQVKARTQELERSNIRFSQAFTLSPIPAVISTLGRETFLEVNEAFLKLTGYSHEEIIGKGAFDLDMWSSLDDQEKISEAQADGKGFRELELHLRSKDGNEHDILLSAEVIRTDGEHGYLKMFYDITDRKQTERELAEALRQVISDTTWFSQQVMERLGYIRAGEPNKQIVELTGRERQILEHIAKGWGNKKIAKDLRLNEQTIRNYISNLYSKLDVHSRAEAIVWARERNIGS